MMGQMSTGQVISIGKQVCEGLVEAHRLRVIHRDLKSSNIMIDRHGQPRIMDFGIARSIKSEGITERGVMVGTPEYISPEQVDGKKADEQSDIYSLGVIMYEMATGRVPFSGESSLSIALKHKTQTPADPRRLNPQIPKNLSLVILKCMEKERQLRYQSAEELLSELEKLEKAVPAVERKVPAIKPTALRNAGCSLLHCLL